MELGLGRWSREVLGSVVLGSGVLRSGGSSGVGGVRGV